MSSTAVYHPDAEINAEVTADAIEARGGLVSLSRQRRTRR